MNSVVTTSSTDGLKVKFTWSAPTNRGSTVFEYEVSLFSMRFTYVTSLSTCDYTFPNVTCEVPHTTLLTTFGYNPGDIVKARA